MMTEDIRFYADPQQGYYPLSAWFPKEIVIDGISYPDIQHFVFENLLAFQHHRDSLREYGNPLDFHRVFDIFSEQEFFVLGNEAIKKWYIALIERSRSNASVLDYTDSLGIDKNRRYIYKIETKNPTPFDCLLGVDENKIGYNCAGEVLMELGDEKRHHIIFESLPQTSDKSDIPSMSRYAVSVCYVVACALINIMRSGSDIDDPEIIQKSPVHIINHLNLHVELKNIDQHRILREYNACNPLTHPIFYYVEMERRYPYHMAEFIRKYECVFLNSRIFAIISQDIYTYVSLSALEDIQTSPSKNIFTLASARALTETKLRALTSDQRILLYTDLFSSFRNDRLRLPPELHDPIMEKMKSWIDSPDDINKIKAFTPTLYFPTFEDDSLHIFMPHGPHLQHNLKMGAYTFDTLYDYIGFYVLASMTHNEKFAYQHMIINKGDNDMFIQFQKGLLSYKDKLLKKALTTRYKDRFFGLVLSSTGKKPIIYMDPFDTSLGFISGVAESNMFGRYLQKIRSNLLSASFKEEYRSLQPIAKDYPFLHDWISGRFRDVLHTLRCINEFTGTKLNEKQTTFFMKTLYKSFFLIHTVEHKDTTHTSSYKPLVDNIVDFYCKQCLAHVVSEDVAKMAMSIVGSVIHYMVHKCDNDASQMIKWISENIKDKEDAPNNSSIVRLFIDMVRAFPKEQRIKSLPYLYRCIVMTDDIPKNPPKVSYQVFENITFSFVTTDMIRPDLNILIPRVFHKNTEGIGLFYFYAHNILSNSSLSRLSFLS